MGVTEHSSKAFEADLDTTRTHVLQMGGLVEAQILAAIEAYASGEAALIESVIENERRVNGYEVAIDGACNHIVVKRQPAASAPGAPLPTRSRRRCAARRCGRR